jgi:transcriptional regulator with XRE-family HTH domain
VLTCERCKGHVSTMLLEEYRDDGSMTGLRNVVILDAAKKAICDECGADNGVSVPDEDGLEAALAVIRIGLPFRLTGEEIRFLRGALELRQKQLSEYLQVRPETMSNWENDKEPIGPQYEKVLRLLVGHALSEQTPGVDFDEEAVLKMRILHSAPPDDMMIFVQRVRVSVDHRKQEAWEPETQPQPLEA